MREGAQLAVAGPDHAADVVQCRAKVAHCHRRLGHLEQALDEYIALSDDLPQDDPLDPLLLEVRSGIGLLPKTVGHPDALETLANLYPVLAEHLGPQAPSCARNHSSTSPTCAAAAALAASGSRAARARWMAACSRRVRVKAPSSW